MSLTSPEQEVITEREGIENEIVANATVTVSIGYSDCFHRYLT